MTPLEKYQAKRHFEHTTEPSGKITKRPTGSKLRFVIQEHEASRLHYDFRIEVDGVLKSWAVPKGPSLNPEDKHLAVMVEDHPYEYRNFEGTIPEGNYGAGTVMIWDEGIYEPVGALAEGSLLTAFAKGVEKGHIVFVLAGKKLNGEFAFIRLRKCGENDWLLVKANDQFASSEDILEQELSARSGKTMDEIRNEAQTLPSLSSLVTRPNDLQVGQANPGISSGPSEGDPCIRKDDKIKKSPLPHNITPMLATLVEEPFDKDDWIFEIKWDGYRAITEISHPRHPEHTKPARTDESVHSGGDPGPSSEARGSNHEADIRLYSRNNKDFNEKFPEIYEAFTGYPKDAVFDGEIVAVDAGGRSDFQLLQLHQLSGQGNLVYYVFDLLYYDGHDLTSLPLWQRREILKQILPHSKTIRFSEEVVGQGTAFFEAAKKKDLEGIMAKSLSSTYQAGKRGHDWLKIKIHQQQEAIICGYTQPRGSRSGFGALILGTHEGDKLHYIGNVGTGFNEKLIVMLMQKMKPLIRKTSPFDDESGDVTGVTWLKPELICEVKFQEWTRDGHMRQPVFLGLREDKTALEVHKETFVIPGHKPACPNERTHPFGRGTRPIPRHPNTAFPSPLRGTKQSLSSSLPRHPKLDLGSIPSPSSLSLRTQPRNLGNIEEDLSTPVEMTKSGKAMPQKEGFSNPDKVFWPQSGITKGDILKYYKSVEKYLLPHLAGRPESLNRFPDGIEGFHFFQKNIETPPAWLPTYQDFSGEDGHKIHYAICNDERALTYVLNLGCIDLNVWSSRAETPDNPDFLVFDLDPVDVTFEEVLKVALAIRDLLEKLQIKSYPKTTGKRGLHIYVPLSANYTYDQTRDFAHLISLKVQDRLPDITSLERMPKNREGRVYLDYLQNRRGATMAAPYSIRPVLAASVSTPLTWEEVEKGVKPEDFTIKNIPARLAKIGDIFAPTLGKGIDLEKALSKLGKL